MNEPSTIELSDGRTLAYAEYGDPDGTPVFCFHGVIGSRLMWSLAADEASDRGIRLVAQDRPGFGGSDFQAGRRLLDWPGDVCALADHLGVDRFGVVGFSGGERPHQSRPDHTVEAEHRRSVGVTVLRVRERPAVRELDRRRLVHTDGSASGFKRVSFRPADDRVSQIAFSFRILASESL